MGKLKQTKMNKVTLVICSLILFITLVESKDIIGKYDVLDSDHHFSTPKTQDRKLLDAGDITDDDLEEDDKKKSDEDEQYTAEEIESAVQLMAAEEGDEFGTEQAGLDDQGLSGNQNQEFDMNSGDQGFGDEYQGYDESEEDGYYGDDDATDAGNYGDATNAGNMKDEL